MLRPRVDETLGVTILLWIDSMRYWVPTYFRFADETLGAILKCLVASVYPPKSESINRGIQSLGSVSRRSQLQRKTR
ncbi:hypothetical protein PVK06_012022 [Gossypium arboreum]|uniref:Uncharacterized protein n=1 Tax=Gossypium arboreum TaxID=29729 RepID=A0ABR0QAF8_GOSAR|nr:hypothetical protein PVK06_012022 [Gossypium arboreum]